MNETKLAETLRAWVVACKAFENAADRRHETHEAVPEDYRYANRAEDYLRGYDEARSEMDPYIEKLERENEALTARVRELEAQIAAQPKPAAVEGCTVRAVGVVGAVLGHSVLNGYDVLVTTTLCSQAEALRIASRPGDRVVAIVDADALVPLASATPVQWMSQTGNTFNYKQGHVCNVPLYPGIAEGRDA